MDFEFIWPTLSSENTLTAVDFPVFIGSDETAVQLLGGEKRMSDWIQKDESTIGLFLRPGDPLSHEVRGEKTRTNNFLIRIPRPRETSSSSSSSSSFTAASEPTTFEGIISETFIFKGMADFAFLPTGIPLNVDGKFVKSFLEGIESTTGPEREIYSTMMTTKEPVLGSLSAAAEHWKQVSQNIGNMGSSIPRISLDSQPSSSSSSSFPWVDRLNRHLNLAPSFFSITDVPQDYTYTGASVEHTSTVVEKRLMHRESFSLKRSYYNFENDLPVPSEPLDVSPPLFNSEYTLEFIIQKLKDAFALRPVWTITSLGIYLRLEIRIFRMQLPAAAYFVRGGCFRNTWIRLGFDPRLDCCSRLFMIAECRIPAHVWKLIPENVLPQVLETKNTTTSSSTVHIDPLSKKTPTADIKLKGGSSMKSNGALSSSKRVAWAEIQTNEVTNKDKVDKEDADDKAGSGGEEAIGDDNPAETMEVSVPQEGASWPWTYWCGGPLVRRLGIQIIDLLWSPEGISHFLKVAGFDHGVGFIPDESIISKKPTVSIGPRGVVVPFSSDLMIEALLYLPTSAAFSKNYGWLSHVVTDQIRRQVARDVCEYIIGNSSTTLNIIVNSQPTLTPLTAESTSTKKARRGQQRMSNDHSKRARIEENEGLRSLDVDLDIAQVANNEDVMDGSRFER